MGWGGVGMRGLGRFLSAKSSTVHGLTEATTAARERPGLPGALPGLHAPSQGHRDRACLKGKGGAARARGAAVGEPGWLRPTGGSERKEHQRTESYMHLEHFYSMRF